MLICLLLIGCDSIDKSNGNASNNDNNSNLDVINSNEPILGCNITTIDKYNICNVYFENGVVSKIEFTSTYPNRELFEEKKEELETLYDNINISDLTISFVIDKDNDKYMEFVGMDRLSIGYICK